jgi:membrane-associated phospholipid phosphatase
LRNRDKARAKLRIFVLLAVLAPFRQAAAQQIPPSVPAVQAGDVVAVAAGAAVALAPRLLGWGRDSAPCAPCDPLTLPAFDRWVLHDPIPVWGSVSWAVLGGLLVAGAIDAGARDGGGPYVTGLVEATVWTTAVTEVSKAAVSRPRPVMYSSLAPGAARDADNLRSFPSGHTSAAFAIATSYWLARRDLTGEPGVAGWAAIGTAGLVGVLRIVAGKHFPSDVLAGALLGIIGGATVHAIKF